MRFDLLAGQPLIDLPATARSIGSTGSTVSSLSASFTEDILTFLISSLLTLQGLVLPAINGVFARMAAKWAFELVITFLNGLLPTPVTPPVAIVTQAAQSLQSAGFTDEALGFIISGLLTIQGLLLPVIPNMFARAAAKWAFNLVISILNGQIKTPVAPATGSITTGSMV